MCLVSSSLVWWTTDAGRLHAFGLTDLAIIVFQFRVGQIEVCRCYRFSDTPKVRSQPGSAAAAIMEAPKRRLLQANVLFLLFRWGQWKIQ